MADRHLHHFDSKGMCTDPRAPGGPCGEKQKYRVHSGQRPVFTDVLVEKIDLTHVLQAVDTTMLNEEGA